MHNSINTYLMYQSANLSDEDYISVNGRRVHDAEANNIVKEILAIASSHSDESSPWAGITGNTFFMKGFFNASDEIGRKMTFLYVAKAENSRVLKENRENIRLALKEELAECDLTLSEDSEICLSDNKTFCKSLSHAKICVALIILLALLIFIITKCNS